MDDPVTRVGVGVIVVRQRLVLMGLRRNSRGAGTWALPGGHLEFGESVEDCAVREVREETGLEIVDLARGPYSVDMIEGRHYVTLFVLAASPSGEPRAMEPHKCADWRWFAWSALPGPLFAPLASVCRAGFVPPACVSGG